MRFAAALEATAAKYVLLLHFSLKVSCSKSVVGGSLSTTRSQMSKSLGDACMKAELGKKQVKRHSSHDWNSQSLT